MATPPSPIPVPQAVDAETLAAIDAARIAAEEMETKTDRLISEANISRGIASRLLEEAKGDYEAALEESRHLTDPIIALLGSTKKQTDWMTHHLKPAGYRVVVVPSLQFVKYFVDSIKQKLVERSALGEAEERISEGGSSTEITVASTVDAPTDAKASANTAAEPDSPVVPVEVFGRMLEEVVVPEIIVKYPGATLKATVTNGEALTPFNDWLNEVLGLRQWTSFATSECRRDKFLMQKALADNHLRSAVSVRVSTLAEAAVALEKYFIPRNLFPIVIKPTLGGGSEFLDVCYTEEDVKIACQVSLGQATKQFTAVQSVVMQEFLQGHEFVVDAISKNSIHVFTDVWYSRKLQAQMVVKETLPPPPDTFEYDLAKAAAAAAAGTTATPVQEKPSIRRDKTAILYDYQELMPHCEPPTEEELDAANSDARARSAALIQLCAHEAVNYTRRCLDALVVTNGGSHTELIVDVRDPIAANLEASPRLSGTGATGPSTVVSPCLVELNPRIQGDVPRSGGVVGFDQISLLAYSLTDKPWPPPGLPPVYDTRRPLPASLDPMLKSASDVFYPHTHGANLPSGPGHPWTVMVVFLRSPCNGVMVEPSRLAIRELPTFNRFTRCSLDTDPQKGSLYKIQLTTDLQNSPGAVVLQGPRDMCLRDKATIRGMEMLRYDIEKKLPEAILSSLSRSKSDSADGSNTEPTDGPRPEPPTLAELYEKYALFVQNAIVVRRRKDSDVFGITNDEFALPPRPRELGLFADEDDDDEDDDEDSDDEEQFGWSEEDILANCTPLYVSDAEMEELRKVRGYSKYLLGNVIPRPGPPSSG